MDREFLRQDEEMARIAEEIALEPQPEIPDNYLPTNEYLEKKVLPHIHSALVALAK